MKTGIFAIYDKKALIFSAPFCSQNQATAIRDFTAVSVDLNTKIGRNPSDFNLQQLGEFDDNSGKIDCFPQPLHVAEALSIADEAVNTQMELKADAD